MFRYVFAAILMFSALCGCVAPEAKEVTLPGYEGAKVEIIRKLRVHQKHLETLHGDTEFEAYRLNFFRRSEQIIYHLEHKKVRFYLFEHESAVMEVRENRFHVRTGIFVNSKRLDRFQQPSVYTQHVICHELSHLVYWSKDSEGPKALEKVPVRELTEYADWFSMLMFFSDDQVSLERFYLTLKQ